MNSTFGITIIALGYELYGTCAYNLALSLKAYDDRIRVCLLYEPSAVKTLTRSELDYFDQMIEIDPNDYAGGYQRAKLCINKYTPYDFTVYLDADNIWLPGKTPSHFIGEVMHDKFRIGMYGGYSTKSGIQKEGYTFWGDPGSIVRHFGIKEFMPQTISGYYSFWKSEENDKLFELARQVYDDQTAPHKKWAGGKADEYCFNVAMGLLGITQAPYNAIYFDKVDGKKTPEEIYKNFWAIAMGTHKCSDNLVVLYNQLVNKYSQVKGMDTRHYHVDKRDVIPERNIF